MKRRPTASQSSRDRFAELLSGLATQEGMHPTAVPGVKVVRISTPERRHPLIYEPMVVFIAQGQKCVYLGNETLRYDTDHYLALSVPVPVECEFDASVAEPLLAVCLAVEPAMLAEILVNLDESARIDAAVPRGIYANRIPGELLSAVVRLVECLRSPADSRILGRQLVREIIYRVLQDEPAGALRALATRNDQFMRIVRVLQHIHGECAQPLGTGALAKLARMSVSAFHHNFKAITATSPLQYVKSVRLHRARMMMIHGGHNASTAAIAVGYESASQFSREFKRFFGAPPRAEAAGIRARLAGGIEK